MSLSWSGSVGMLISGFSTMTSQRWSSCSRTIFRGMLNINSLKDLVFWGLISNMSVNSKCKSGGSGVFIRGPVVNLHCRQDDSSIQVTWLIFPWLMFLLWNYWVRSCLLLNRPCICE